MTHQAFFNWEHVNLFVAVADTGSMSAAARETGVSQPTIGRAIAALEADLGVSLFARHSKGLHLTEQGEGLVAHARSMARSAAELSLAAAGRSQKTQGTVRITASQIVATYILPPILARLRREEPLIQIELVATDNVENLLFREADIAIRMLRPTQQELIAKHVGDMKMGIYASNAYLSERPEPHTMEDMELHSIIGYDRSTLIIDKARELGAELNRDMFSMRCDDQVVHWQLVLAGLGIGFMAQAVAQNDHRVVRILHGMDLGSLPLWLTSHTGLKSNHLVRTVFDHLSEHLPKAIA